jgi:hypothetical protein
METVTRNFINLKFLVFLLFDVCVAILWVLLESKCLHSSVPVLCRFHQCQVMAGDTVCIPLQGRCSCKERVSSTISCPSSACMSFTCFFCCCLQDAALNAGSPVLRLTRAGETAWGELPGEDWTIFSPNHSTYEPLAWATRNSEDFLSAETSRTPLPTVLQVCLQLTAFVRDSVTSYQCLF